MAADWAVCMTHPSREHIAARNVSRQSHRYYLPQFYDRTLKRRRPLFPSYLFVHAPDKMIGYLRSTTGISKVIVKDEGQPAMLDNAIIDGLRAQENDNGIISMDNAKRGFRKGDRVRICYSNMNHVEAIFECMTARQRVKLLLRWMGQHVPVIVPVDQIERAA